jgi:hypothetical protein
MTNEFRKGFIAGLRKARTLMRKEVDSAIDRLEGKTAELETEMVTTREEITRMKTLDAAIVERQGATVH